MIQDQLTNLIMRFYDGNVLDFAEDTLAAVDEGSGAVRAIPSKMLDSLPAVREKVLRVLFIVGDYSDGEVLLSRYELLPDDCGLIVDHARLGDDRKIHGSAAGDNEVLAMIEYEEGTPCAMYWDANSEFGVRDPETLNFFPEDATLVVRHGEGDRRCDNFVRVCSAVVSNEGLRRGRS